MPRRSSPPLHHDPFRHRASISASRSRRPDRRQGTSRYGAEILEERLTPTTSPTAITETLVTTASNQSAPTAMEFSPTNPPRALDQGGRVDLVGIEAAAPTPADPGF